MTVLAATAAEQAYAFIREQILSGRYPGGTRLNLDEIAERLRLSRMPVRDALRRLDSEGLVTVLPHRGATVTTLSPKDILELFEMRAVLEGLAIRLALPKLGRTEVEDLEETLARMHRVRGDPKLWLDRHDEFHYSLSHRSDRPRLIAETSRLRGIVRPYVLMYVNVYQTDDIAGHEHRAIVDTLGRNDPVLAEETVRSHIMASASGVVEFLDRIGLGGGSTAVRPDRGKR